MGRLIVLEGLDGVGKSTLARGLADALGAVFLRTPPESLQAPRPQVDLALARHPGAAQLFYAATVLAASEQATKVLARGQDVVMDRYWLTTRVYARHGGAALELREVERRLLPADVTLLLNLDEQERRRRMAERGINDNDRMTLRGDNAWRILDAYRDDLRRAVAGQGIVLDISGLSPDESVAAALRCCEAAASQRPAAMMPTTSDGPPRCLRQAACPVAVRLPRAG